MKSTFIFQWQTLILSALLDFFKIKINLSLPYKKEINHGFNYHFFHGNYQISFELLSNFQ